MRTHLTRQAAPAAPFLSFILHYLNTQGLSEESIASALKLEENWATKIQSQELSVLLPKIFLLAQSFTQDEYLGLHAGEQFHFCLAGLGGLVATHAPTPHQALVDIAELVPDTGVLSVELMSGEETTQIGVRCPSHWPLPNCAQLLDTFFSGITSALRHLAGPKLMPNKLLLLRPAPFSKEAYHRLYGDVVLFGQEQSLISFRTSDLEVKSKLYQAGLYEQLRFSAELSSTSEANERRTINEIKNTIRSGAFSLESVAKHLNRPQRSVQRSLHSCGTNFRQLLSETRAELAIEMLRDTDRSVNSIASSLQYTHGRALSRAVKNATGLTPAALRSEIT